MFNGNNLAGWKYCNPNAKKVWVVCDDVRIDPSNPGKLLPVGSGGSPAAALLCGDDGRGSDIMTDEAFGDYQLHLSSPCPRAATRACTTGACSRSRSSIATVFPSSRFTIAELYERAIPSENHARPPGQWQSYDITMAGKMLSLIWNGKPVYKDMDVRYGETDREAYDRLNRRTPASPRHCGSSCAGKTASTSAISVREGPGRASTAPTGPVRSCSRATMALSLIEISDRHGFWGYIQTSPRAF